MRVGDTDAAEDPVANTLCAAYDSPYLEVYNLNCDTPLVGRYVSVRLRPGAPIADDDRLLTLCEVQVRQPRSCASPTHLPVSRPPVAAVTLPTHA